MYGLAGEDRGDMEAVLAHHHVALHNDSVFVIVSFFRIFRFVNQSFGRDTSYVYMFLIIVKMYPFILEVWNVALSLFSQYWI